MQKLLLNLFIYYIFLPKARHSLYLLFSTFISQNLFVFPSGHPFSMSVSFSPFLFLPLSLSFSFARSCFPPALALWVSSSLSLSLWLTLSLSLAVSLSVSLSLPLSLSPSLSGCLSLSPYSSSLSPFFSLFATCSATAGQPMGGGYGGQSTGGSRPAEQGATGEKYFISRLMIVRNSIDVFITISLSQLD